MARLVREVVDDHEQDDGNEQDGCHEEKDDEYEEQDGGDEEQDGGDEEQDQDYEEHDDGDEEPEGQTLEPALLSGYDHHEVQVRYSDSDDDDDENLYAACYGPSYSDDEVQLDDDPLRDCIFRTVLARPRVRTPQQDGCPLSVGEICFYARRYAQVLIAPNSADSIDTETLRRRLAVRLSQAMMAVHPPLGSWTQNSSGVWTQNSSSSQRGSA